MEKFRITGCFCYTKKERGKRFGHEGHQGGWSVVQSQNMHERRP
jgi:hypothetical protein